MTEQEAIERLEKGIAAIERGMCDTPLSMKLEFEKHKEAYKIAIKCIENQIKQGNELK